MSRADKQRGWMSLKDVFPSWFGYFFGGRAKLSGPSDADDTSGGDNPTGMSVNLTSTLQLSAAWACIRLLSETIATLPCNIYQRSNGNDRRPANSHSLYDLLHNSPNADMTAVSFWQGYVASMLTSGFGVAEKVSSAGQVVAINLLFAPNLSARRTKDGWEYRYFSPSSGTERIIPEDRLWITPAFSLDGVIGLSPIRYGASVLGTAMAADESAGRWFGSGMRPSGVLQTDKILTPAQRDDMRKNIADKFSGVANSSKTMVLEAGMKYDQISIPPEEAQLLETRSFGVEEICRWFGVPPIMVGHSEKVTAWGTGIEQIIIGFLTFSVRPWLTRLEQSISRSLIAVDERQQYYAQFAVEGLLRADSTARAGFYSSMVQNGLYLRNEVRKLENLPPVEGGDIVTVQSNLIAIDKLGSGPTAEQQLSNALAQLIKRHEIQ